MSTPQQPSHKPWLVLILLTLVGLGLSAYLTYIHVGVHTNPSFSSGCNINKTLNCESVALSSYAVIANLPTSVWGLLGYLFVLVVGLIGWRRQANGPSPVHGWLLLLASVCLVAGLFFAYISWTQIKAWCLHCVGTYGINIGIFAAALWVLSTEQVSGTQGLQSFFSWLPRNLLALLAPGFVVVVLVLGYPKYWLPQWNGVALPFQVCGMPTADSQMPHGEEEGVHWIGSKNPIVRIVEYADYECPYCQRAHFNMRALLRKCPRAIRLYHRHYPLDHACNPRIHKPFHEKACLLAKAAYCAGKQGKFWEANDFLYTRGKKVEASQLAQVMSDTLGVKGDPLHTCIQSQQAGQEIDKDMQAGRDLKMQGTPFFVMNDVPYSEGTIPNEAILKALQSPVKSASSETPKTTPASSAIPQPSSVQHSKVSPATPRQTASQPTVRPAASSTPQDPPKPPTFQPLAPPRFTNPATNR